MPRDSRLYMTFPIDFHRHPKISRLSDAAFRAFVEANGESRIAESDGRLEAADAEFHWKPEVLAELVGSHPTRPVLLRDGDAYVIRDYAEHQFTTADRERLAEISRQNGAKGGRPRNPEKPAQVFSEPRGTQSKPESESESESESGLGTDNYFPKSSPVSNRESATDGLEEMSRSVIEGSGINPERLVSHILTRTGRNVSMQTAMRIATDLIGKGGDRIADNQKYVLGSITKSWAEIQQYIDTEGLGL